MTRSPGDTHAVLVVGGGIVGLASARALLQRGTTSIVVLEAESRPGMHQTGHNSGVIHSGLYYRPGSLKAENCVAGRAALLRYCDERGVPYDLCGKLVVATRQDEVAMLRELEQRGRANGLAGVRRVAGADLREFEPHVDGIEGLWVPETGIVDYDRVVDALAAELTEAGVEIRTGARVERVERAGDRIVVHHAGGRAAGRLLVACAGLYADRLARICGLDPGVRILPFRGEYLDLRSSATHLVRNLIYPVPDPRFPFLGVHFTRRISGGVEAGPNAVLAWRREGYDRLSFSGRDAHEILTYSGFWRLAGRYWRTGIGEVWRSWSVGAMVRALRRLVPDLRLADVERGGSGVRAQAVGRDGRLLDDFHIVEGPGMIHVINAPSPAATAALSIGETIAERAARTLATG